MALTLISGSQSLKISICRPCLSSLFSILLRHCRTTSTAGWLYATRRYRRRKGSTSNSSWHCKMSCMRESRGSRIAPRASREAEFAIQTEECQRKVDSFERTKVQHQVELASLKESYERAIEEMKSELMTAKNRTNMNAGKQLMMETEKTEMSCSKPVRSHHNLETE